MFHLIHSCTIQRYTITSDAYGNSKRTATDLALRVPCRLIERAEKMADGVTGQILTSTSYRLLLDPDQDVIASDRITDIVDRTGSAISGNYEVMAAIPHEGQMTRLITCELNKVS